MTSISHFVELMREQTTPVEVLIFVVMVGLVLYATTWAVYYLLLVVLRRWLRVGQLPPHHWFARGVTGLILLATALIIAWTLAERQELLQKMRDEPCKAFAGAGGKVCCPMPMSNDACKVAVKMSAGVLADFLTDTGQTASAEAVYRAAYDTASKEKGRPDAIPRLIRGALAILLLSTLVIAWTRDVTEPRVTSQERARLAATALCIGLLLLNVPLCTPEALAETATRLGHHAAVRPPPNRVEHLSDKLRKQLDIDSCSTCSTAS